MRGWWALALLVCGGSAMAQTAPGPSVAAPNVAPPGGVAPVQGMRPGMGQSVVPHAFVPQSFIPMNPAIQADTDAINKMAADMSKPYTGDPDQDFVSHMEPHHQAAIDMAEAELKYGSDAKLKQLAARIISAQQREIAFMQAWQSKHPMKPAPRVDNPHIQYK